MRRELLTNTRKTECGAIRFLAGLVVRAAPFALLRRGRVLGFVLASRRTAPLLQYRQPSRRTPPALALSPGQTLQRHDGLFDVFPLLAQFPKHFNDIHLVLLAPLYAAGIWVRRSENRTELQHPPVTVY